MRLLAAIAAVGFASPGPYDRAGWKREKRDRIENAEWTAGAIFEHCASAFRDPFFEIQTETGGRRLLPRADHTGRQRNEQGMAV